MSKTTSLVMLAISAILGAVMITLYFIPSVPVIAFGIVGAMFIFVIGVYAMMAESHENTYIDNLAYAPINNPFHRW